MRKLFFILLLFISVTGYSQKQYIPWLQTDDTHVLSNFVLNGDTFRITGPANGQIIQRVSGKWINVPSPASVFDSLVWNPGTGDLVSWKDGSPFTTENLDGRYAVNDGNVGDMLKSVYDTATISEQVVGLTASQTLSNKILILPTIANFTNAQHNHSTAETGGLINSDNITQGTVNFFSRWGKNGNIVYYNTGSVAIGKTTAGSALDVVGTTTTQGLNVTSTINFDGLTITDIQPGASGNSHLVTKGYVDEQILSAGGYTDEQAQDAIGTILDDGTIGDVVFTYDDTTPKITGVVEDDSHNHTGSSISGLSSSNFTSQNISQWTNNSGYLTEEVDGSTTNELITSVTYASDTLNITEAGTTHKVKITAGSVSGVTSFNTRTGAVVPATGDYTYSMVTNAPGLNAANLFTENQYVSKASPYFFARYTSASSGSGFVVTDSSYVNRMTFGFNSTSGIGYIFSQYDHPFRIMLNNVEQSRFNTSGVLELRNLTASPTAAQSNFGGFYVKNNLPYFITSTGTEYDLSAGGGSSQWTSDTYGIYYTNNVGIGSLGASNSGIALDVYKSLAGGYSGSFTNPSSSGHGISSHIGSTSDSYLIGKFMSSNIEKISITGGGAMKIIERAVPGTPEGGYGYLYAKTDNKLYFKNDAGTEYDLTSSGGTSYWTDDGTYLKPSTSTRNVMVTNTQPSLRFIDTDFPSRNYSIDFNTDKIRFSFYNGATYYDQYITQYGFYGGQVRLFASSYEDIDGVIRYSGSDILGRVGGVWKSLTASSSGSGTVTSVAAGNGMNFTTITATGTVTMGTPSSITTSSTNSATSGTHTHTLDLSGRSVSTTNSLTGGGNLSADRTIQLVNDTSAPGANKSYGTDSLGVRRWNQSQNMTVRTLISGSNVLWDVKNGVNAKLAITGNTTITMKNLVPGSTGNLTVYNAGPTYTLTFAGSYSYLVSPIIRRTTASPNTSGSSKIDVFSWYYDGTDVFINGTLDYGIYYQ